MQAPDSVSAHVVNLRQISTPRERCLMLQTGVIERESVDEAELARFDQLPVIDESGILRRLVQVTHARQLLEAGCQLALSDPALVLHEVDAQLPVLTLLEELEKSRAVIIRDIHDNDQAVDWFAMVTISDLNRHPFRSHVYPILAELEAALAALIDRYFDDPWTWLPLTGEDAQVSHIGRWELEKRRGVDTSPITGCTLIDMINVVARSEELLKELGFRSKTEFKNLTGSFRDVRNQVMHPVRPLILDPEDVGKLHITVRNIVHVTERAVVKNTALSQEGKAPLRYLP